MCDYKNYLKMCTKILEHVDSVKRYVSKDKWEMVFSIAEKGSVSTYKLSPKQSSIVDQVYNKIYNDIDKKEIEEKRRNSLSEFDKLWEDNSSHYIDYEVDWGSGRTEYISKDTFRTIYDDLQAKIKKLEQEISATNSWKR